MKKFKRFAAIFLSATMIFSMVTATGCGKKANKNEVETIDEDAPWYSVNQYEIGDDYSEDDYEYIYGNVLGTKDDTIFYQVQGSLVIPDDFDWENDNYNDYMIEVIETYDFDGNKTGSYDLWSLVREERAFDLDNDDAYINNIALTDEGIEVTVNVYNYSTIVTKDEYYSAILDLESGEFSEFTETDASNNQYMDEMSFEGTSSVGDGYSIDRYWIWGDDNNYSYLLKITDPDGSVAEVDLRDVFPNTSIYDISTFITISDTEAICNPSIDGTSVSPWYIIDLQNHNVSEFDEDMSWLDDIDLYNLSLIPEVGSVVLNGKGIQKIDFDNNEVTELFNFNDCNINRSMVTSLSLLSYSEDRIVLGGSYYNSVTGINYEDSSYIIVLEKCDENPNAGKTIINLAVLDYTDNAIAQAICDFNEASTEYYVQYDSRYSLYDRYSDDYDDDTDWTQVDLDARTELSNDLAMDLMAGDGPDIIINGFGFTQLNNDDYLLDLTEYFDGQDCFTNIIDAAKTGDKLYQIPLSVQIQAIATYDENVSNGQTGFTFDEYADFVDEVCNGTDPLTYNQLDFFTMILATMSDSFYDGENMNFDTDEFREFAEYVKENVPEEYPFDEDNFYYDWGAESFTAEYTEIWGFGQTLQGYSYDVSSVRYLGLPSVDGRGPSMDCQYSVAISAATGSEEGCWSFVETLLSEDVQKMYFSSGVPVNRNAFETVAQMAVDERNSQVEREMKWYSSEEEARSYGLVEIDDSVVDNFVDTIENCSSFAIMDPAVQTIVREEIQPYFSGQKDIDSVLDIIMDKVQTYLNERG